MYNIKIIEDSDLYTLLDLHYQLQQLLPTKFTRSVSAWLLLHEFNGKDRIIAGLYKDGELCGFCNGYGESEDMYYFSNMYVLKDHRRGVKLLMDTVIEMAGDMGYEIWRCESITPEGKNIMEKYGAKEIKWEAQ